jgi:diaminopimelate decarboxylase
MRKIGSCALSLGGGFPAAYADTPPSLISTIEEALLRLPYPVQLLAEPGRCLAAPARVLVASVIGIADRGSTRWVHLDVGAFNGLMESLGTGIRLTYPIRDSRGQSITVRCALHRADVRQPGQRAVCVAQTAPARTWRAYCQGKRLGRGRTR